MSGSEAPPAPSTYQFQNQGTADQQAYGQIGQIGSAPNYGQQAYDAFAPGLYGSSGASGWNPQDTVNAGNYITSSAAPLANYGFNLLNQGMDPQNELYQRTQQQLQDQVRAGQASRGIAMTPYGAGLEGKAMNEFNIDWRNSQVQRGAQAAQGAAPLFQQMDKNVVTGQQLAMAAPELQMRMMNGLQTGGMGTQAMPQQVLDNLFKYLSGGNAADNTAVNKYGNQIKAYQVEQANNAAMMNGIGRLAGNAMMFML